VVAGVSFHLSSTITASNPITLNIEFGSSGEANIQVISHNQQTVSYQLAASNSMLGL
jgi:hypothetical protein